MISKKKKKKRQNQKNYEPHPLLVSNKYADEADDGAEASNISYEPLTSRSCVVARGQFPKYVSRFLLLICS